MEGKIEKLVPGGEEGKRLGKESPQVWEQVSPETTLRSKGGIE